MEKNNSTILSLMLAGLMTISFSPEKILAQPHGETKTKQPVCRKLTPVVNSEFTNNYLSTSTGQIVDDNERIQTYAGTTLNGNGWGLFENLSLYTWGDFDIEQERFEEVDIGLTAPLKTNYLSLKLSGAAFFYPNSNLNTTGEIGLEISPKTEEKLPLKPSLYVGQALGNEANGLPNGKLIQLALQKRKELTGKTSLSLEGTLNYSDQYCTKERGFSNAYIEGKLQHNITKALSLHLGIGHSLPLNDGFNLEDQTQVKAGITYCLPTINKHN